MSVVWSILFAAVFARYGRGVMTAMGLAVFSHFLLDLPMHPPDLALWPYSTAHLGFGFWRIAPNGWWFLELTVIVVLWAFYWQRARHDLSFGRRPFAILAVLGFLNVFNSPWLSQL